MLSLHSIIADIHLNRIHIYSSTTCHWTDKKKKEKKKEKKEKNRTLEASTHTCSEQM